MKKQIIVGAICAVLGAALTTAWAGPPPGKQQPADGPSKPADPKLMGALARLEAGRMDLVNGPDDKAGHKKRALEFLDKALAELREAIEPGSGEHKH